VGTLYNHFADRQTLIDSLISQHRETLLSQVRAAEERTRDLPVRAQLVAMLTAMSQGWSRIFLVVRQGEQIPDTKKRAEFRQRFEDLFRDVLARGRKQGAVADDPDGLQHIVLEGLIKAVFVLAIDNPKRLALADAPAFVVERFLHGVAPKRGGK
jgi:AcrR family transcriptional regulator